MLGLIGLLVIGIIVRTTYKMEQVCAAARNALAQSPSLTAELGYPIDLQCGWTSYFELTDTTTGSKAYLIADIEGPKGRGTIELTLIKKNSTWETKEVTVIPLPPSGWTERKFLLALLHSGIGLSLYSLTILFSRQFAVHRRLSTRKWTFEAIFFHVLLLLYIAWQCGAEEGQYRTRALLLFSGFAIWIVVGIYLVSMSMI